ncbi:DNA-dependent protein kinase catalytic subunit isoform X1 [Paramormyrops kingsleyae]|uniref:DNA-dependent protein kinase catalytic subunit isoform X1 n=1 Tax=Paramormyrops kingsleyae TaxID=1676925 RepID=UPI003B979367
MASGRGIGEIQDYLLKLHSFLSDSEIRYAALQCHDIIGDLGQECLIPKRESDFVFQTSLLFSKEEGLLSFIRKSISHDELRDARLEILSLLEKLLQKLSSECKGWEKNHAVDIKDMCLLVYTKDKTAKSRIAALELLIKVLFVTKDSAVAHDFKVAEIFNKFYGELGQRSKLPDTVHGNIYELLGALGEVQPAEMINNSEKLFKACLGELKAQMTSLTKEPKLPIVAGCLKGLTSLMVHFTKCMDEDPQTSKEIFDYALKAISPQTEMKRYAVTFAGLRLFARHSSQFSSCLMDHYKTVFDVMSKWCGHINVEMKKTSYYALESFLKQIASLVTENVELHKSKLKFFMQKFCAIIKNMDSSQKELSIAIRGYGLFAAPCKVVSPQDVDFMYTELIQRCKQMYLTESDTQADNIYQLPSFLDSLASVLYHLDTIPEVYTPVLEHLLVLQIDCFPQYSPKMMSACSCCIIKIFMAMARKGPVLWNFLSTVMHQGLIRVCSKPVLLNEAGAKSSDRDLEPPPVRTGKWEIPSYRDYLDLFRGLLNCENIKESVNVTFDMDRSVLKSLNRHLYDELVRSMLKIIKKLDLSVQKVNSETESMDVQKQGENIEDTVIPSSDPTAHLQPNKPNDFMVLINLTDFCSELLLKRDAGYFQQWVYPMGQEIILQSSRFPLISGFYKLLSIGMKLAKRLKYFQQVVALKSSHGVLEKYACFLLFTKFGKEVSVRMKQYKDELLASCLTFLLSLDHHIVSLDIKAYIPALQAAFKLGLSHPPLATAALDALEEWSSNIPQHDMQPYYKDVLPCLDAYLKTSGSNDQGENNWEVLCLSSGEEKGHGKVLMRLMKKSRHLSLVQDSQSTVVRLRVVQLLGHLGGQLNRSLVTATSAEEMMKKCVAWDSEKRLNFAVPFADMKPVIFLDTFLPRITELALSSSDRQTKVVACELLHSIVVYMLGKSSQIPEQDKCAPPMYNLHKRIFPVLLLLACDVDQVTRQLYEPLVMQLIHWFTSNKKFESQDTVAVLEAILDGLVNPEDCKLRDFCGQCIHEFFKWSIKQTTPKQQKDSHVNIKSLFKRIYSLALHPNVFKRLGAALAFNSIYKQFREEKPIVEQFVFEALVTFVESLALAHSDEKSLGSLQQCGDAVGHLKRIIKHFAVQLNQCIKRRVPRGFPPDKPMELLDIVMWLLVQCGRPQTECRHKCMELFYEFVPLLPGLRKAEVWLEDLLEQKGFDFLIDSFEGGGYSECSLGLLSKCTLQDLDEPFNMRATLQWMDMLLAALDCYNTFIELQLVKPTVMQSTTKKSRFLKALQFFIDQLATQDIAAAEICFPVRQKVSVFSPKEKEDYNYSKGTIIVRLMEFVTMLLDKCHQDFWKFLEQYVLSDSFFELVALVICEPSVVGFNMADVEVMMNLPKVCVSLMKATVTTPYKSNLERSVKKWISRESVSELCGMDLYDKEARANNPKLERILLACRQLYQGGLLESIFQSMAETDLSLGSRLLSVVYKGVVPKEEGATLPSMDVSSRKLADELLQLAFSIGQENELVDLLLNNTMISLALSGSAHEKSINFLHGEYFYSLFQTTVNSELLRKLDGTVPVLMKSAVYHPRMISTLLNGMLDHCFRERILRKNQGSTLVGGILRNWSSLRPWWTIASSSSESKIATLTLLSKVLQIDSAVCFSTSHEAFEEVFTTYTTLLADVVLPLNLKNHALIILPFFTALPEEPLAQLRKALELFVASHFPLQSHEFPRGTLDYNNYTDSIKKFLDALELSQSPLLLKLMAEVLCRDQKHIMEEQFQTCFKRIAKRSSCERQVALLNTMYRTVMVDVQPLGILGHAFVERTLLTLLQHCSADALRQFFIENVPDIMTTLQPRFTKSNETTFETQVIKKNGCYKLLEVLYSRLPKAEVYTKESKINMAFVGSGQPEGNELSKSLLRCCFEAFTENMVGETQLLERRRQYHCAAYNCAIALISCCFNETKFYQGFLFSEKAEKSQFIFENIIDTQRAYRFPVEIDVPLERKQKYVTIRKETMGNSGEEPRYLSSQSCMDSSLREEMSQFDFSTGVQSFSYRFQNPGNETTAASSGEQMETVSQDEVMDLEMDELNQHECMASMTALLSHMQRNSITPKIEQGTTPTELPPWMKYFHGKLGNSTTPLNVRLFIAKIIINSEKVFRPYAKFWLGPLLQLVVSGNNGGDGIHFMVVDIVATALSWTSIATPKGNTKDEVLANWLLEFLIKNCFHQRRAVFRHNLEIIKIVVECWKDCLNVPYSLIHERFAGTDLNSKDNSVGLQLLGIVLANNLPPYDPKCGIEHDRYIRSLVNNLSIIRYKEVYSAAAEIIGCMMRYLAEKNEPSTTLFDLTVSKLMELKKSDKDDKFIVCLSKVSKHFAPFMDRFVNQIFFLLPKLHGSLKTHCLECVLCRASEIPDIYLQLKRKDFLQVMGHRDEARQRICLDLVHKILPILKPEEVQEVLGLVSSFITHPSPVCRERMYDILMWIHDNYSDAESQADPVSLAVFSTAKEPLLQGLVDENQGLQLYVHNFWSHESRLPTATLDRTLAVLRSLYSCKIEDHFLSLATNMLLEMTSRSPDYTRAMFEYPLSDCKFQDYVIDSNWRHRSTVLTPMFVETQTSQTGSYMQSQNAAASSRGSAGAQLRVTQDSLEFTPTQTTGKRAAFNWLTGNSIDTLADYPLQTSSESVSSLLVFEKRDRTRMTRKAPGADFGTKRLTALDNKGNDQSAKAASEQQADIMRLKRRFLKDQEKVSLHFAKKGIREQKSEKEHVANKKLQKEAKVTLYRSYRVGDLPDIQIQYKSIIAPLQALAQRDATLAKQLFSSLFSGILSEMQSFKTSAEKKKINEQLLEDMNNFLSKSTVYFPPFVACVQDMSYQHKDLLSVHPENVSSSCLASLQQPIGILLLEKSLIQDQAPHPPAKRARRDQPPDTLRWIHLARLYRSLGDYDVVRGIFCGKIGTKPITRTALQAEAKSDYAEAVKLYNEALNTEEWMDDEPTEAEKDFWEMAVLEAYSHLTEWKSLQYCATINIDNSTPIKLEKIWTEPFYQDVYLPYLMRSMLKQLQLGDQSQTLLSFVDAAMKLEERKNIMETYFSQELSLLYILQEDYDRAKYYINNCMEIFIQNYSTIDMLLNRSRLAKLQLVQPLTEIRDFLHFITSSVSSNSLRTIINTWTNRFPDPKMDPMNVWDDIITTRCFFLDKISEKLTSLVTSDCMEVEDSEGIEQKIKVEDPPDFAVMIRECKFNMKLRMADSARKQSNFALASKLLKELHKESKTRGSWMQRWVHSFSRFSHRRSRGLGQAEQVSAMLKVVPLLEEVQTENAPIQIYQDQKILLGTTYCIIASAVSKELCVLEKIGSDKSKRLLELSGASTSEQMVVGLQKRAFTLFHSAAERAEMELPSSSTGDVDTSMAIKAYMSLANFCDKRLREEEKSSTVSEYPELLTFPVTVMEMMLKALKLNSKEARLKFPRLLQIVELYPAETLNLMAREIASVPCWQLISWISQMMALLDKQEAVAVQQIIGEIADSYPQALVYPYMISCESYNFDDSATGHRNKEFVTSLKSKLDKRGIINDFMEALQQLTNPEMLFKDWWDSVKNELEKPSLDKKMIAKMYDEMYSSLGNLRAEGLGSFRKKFIQKYAKEIEALLGRGATKVIAKKSNTDFLKNVDDLAGKMRGFQKEPGNLKEYSPWLSNFRAEMLQEELEIPGQYDGLSKPMPEYHAKIKGFDERVKVMSSIRRPKRLIIRGHDERDYPFLVKGGEDLRQDQRIEQLFSIMNIILSQDAACSQRNMKLSTYQVVPMTTRIGLIEWMENTCTLKEFLYTRMTEDEQQNATRPHDVFDNWLTRVAGKVNGILRYAEAYKKAKRADTVTNFKKIENLVPENLLRRAFIKMSTSPEAFHFLRSHFISGHALICVSHWILGIGDRHLSNFMIKTETGGVVGIDFGHAFGSATQFLPVPEMMPFRLTRQFLNLMQPMHETDLIHSIMVHSLRAYRADPDLLLNTMDVFVKEPSLDWKNFELKQLKKGGTWTQTVNTKEINWYPMQKVNIARRKLEGANPADITCEELKLGFEKASAFKGMLAVAQGQEEHNVRARERGEELSVETQVDCLLDQATDPNILGRVWNGWEPWI